MIQQRENQNKADKIDSKSVLKALRSLISCSSFGLIGALIEIGYSKKLYSDSEMKKLEEQAEEISSDLLEELFVTNESLSQDILLQELEG